MAVIACGLLLPLGAGAAVAHHDWQPPQALEPGDPRYLEDIRECTESIAAGSETNCVAFYTHFVLGSFQVLTLQRPPDCAEGHVPRSFFAPGVEPILSQSRVASSYMPGYVDYGLEECETTRNTAAGWMNQDLEIDPVVPMIGYWYLTANGTGGIGSGDPQTGVGSGALPCITVRMVLETGRTTSDPSRVVKIAEGQATKTVLTSVGEDPPPVQDPCPGSEGTIEAENATEFRVELDGPETHVPWVDLFTLRVHWYHHAGASNNPDQEDNIVSNQGSVYMDRDRPNRVVLPINPDMQIPPFIIERDGQNLLFRTQIWSGLGAHDLDLGSVHLELHDDDGNLLYKAPARLGPPWPQWYSNGNFTTLWNLSAEAYEPGDYTATINVTNWQHTQAAQEVTRFTIGDDLQVYLPHKNETPPMAPQGGQTKDLLPYLLVVLTAAVVMVVIAGAHVSRRKW